MIWINLVSWCFTPSQPVTREPKYNILYTRRRQSYQNNMDEREEQEGELGGERQGREEGEKEMEGTEWKVRDGERETRGENRPKESCGVGAGAGGGGTGGGG